LFYHPNLTFKRIPLPTVLSNEIICDKFTFQLPSDIHQIALYNGYKTWRNKTNQNWTLNDCIGTSLKNTTHYCFLFCSSCLCLFFWYTLRHFCIWNFNRTHTYMYHYNSNRTYIDKQEYLEYRYVRSYTNLWPFFKST